MALLTRIRTVFTGVAGTPWYSNQYWAIGSGDPDPVLDDTEAFWEGMAAMIKSTVVGTVEGTCAVIESTTGQTVGVKSAANRTCTFTNTADPLPWATQGVITLRTGEFTAGREIRGRIFVPGISEEYCTNGILSTSATALMQAAADELLSESSEAWHVYSPTHLTSAAVTAVSTTTKPGVLRSRRD